MNNGCICCTVRGDLIRILGKLMKRKDKFDYILIETTGLADPGPVAQTFFVDDEVKAQAPARRASSPSWTPSTSSQQLDDSARGGGADRLRRRDPAQQDRPRDAEDLAKVEGKIKSINPYARIHRTQKSNIELGAILDKGAFDLKRIL